jgi:hypothetical protein
VDRLADAVRGWTGNNADIAEVSEDHDAAAQALASPAQRLVEFAEVLTAKLKPSGYCPDSLQVPRGETV